MKFLPNLRLLVLLSLFWLMGCGIYTTPPPFQQISFSAEDSTRVFWLSPEQAPPPSARALGDFEYVAHNKKEGRVALNKIGEDAEKLGANTVYIERFISPTTSLDSYMFIIKGTYYLASDDSVNDILWRRESAIDTCNCAYVYVFRSQLAGGDNYWPIDLFINGEPVGGLSNQKGYKISVPLGEVITIESSIKGGQYELAEVDGYHYVYGYSSSPPSATVPVARTQDVVAVAVIKPSRGPQFYREIYSFHGRLLAESLYLNRR